MTNVEGVTGSESSTESMVDWIVSNYVFPSIYPKEEFRWLLPLLVLGPSKPHAIIDNTLGWVVTVGLSWEETNWEVHIPLFRFRGICDGDSSPRTSREV